MTIIMCITVTVLQFMYPITLNMLKHFMIHLYTSLHKIIFFTQNNLPDEWSYLCFMSSLSCYKFQDVSVLQHISIVAIMSMTCDVFNRSAECAHIIYWSKLT